MQYTELQESVKDYFDNSGQQISDDDIIAIAWKLRDIKDDAKSIDDFDSDTFQEVIQSI